MATRREAHIVGEPVNAHDLTLVSSEAHAIGNGASVEIEHMDLLILNHAGKEMASVRKLYLATALEHVGLEREYLFAQHITQYDFVLQSDDQV